MADPELSVNRVLLQQRSQTFIDLALLFAQAQPRAVQHRHARAVIAAVLQPPQPFDQDRSSRFCPDVTDDATHIYRKISGYQTTNSSSYQMSAWDSRELAIS